MFDVLVETMLADEDGSISLQRPLRLAFAPVAGVNSDGGKAFPGFSLEFTQEDGHWDLRHVHYDVLTSQFKLLVQSDQYDLWIAGGLPAPDVAAVLEYQGWEICSWDHPGEKVAVDEQGLTDRIKERRAKFAQNGNGES